LPAGREILTIYQYIAALSGKISALRQLGEARQSQKSRPAAPCMMVVNKIVD
jgi:alkylated DNA nucleotide flippase Atl1